MPFRANGRNGIGTGALFGGGRSDSSAGERSLGEGGVNEGVARIIELGVSRKVVAEFDSVGNEIENPIRSGIVFHRGEIGTERRIHRIRRASRGIENAPSGSSTGYVLDHEVFGLESEVHERAVGTSISDVRSEFRETGNFRPKVRDVGLSGNVVVGGLVRIEYRRVGNSVETAGSGRRGGSVVEPGTPRSVGVRRPRLVDGGVVRGPVVVTLGVIVPIEILRKIHRRFRTERMGNLTGVRPVPRIRHDVESRERAFFPVPCDESPAGLVDVHVDAETVRIERRQRGRGGFPERGIGFQNLVRSAGRVDEPIGVNGIAGLSPDQVGTEREPA